MCFQTILITFMSYIHCIFHETFICCIFFNYFDYLFAKSRKSGLARVVSRRILQLPLIIRCKLYSQHHTKRKKILSPGLILYIFFGIAALNFELIYCDQNHIQGGKGFSADPVLFPSWSFEYYFYENKFDDSRNTALIFQNKQINFRIKIKPSFWISFIHLICVGAVIYVCFAPVFW